MNNWSNVNSRKKYDYKREKHVKWYVAPIPKEVIAYKQQIAIMEEKNKEFRKNEDYWKQDAWVIYNTYF